VDFLVGRYKLVITIVKLHIVVLKLYIAIVKFPTVAMRTTFKLLSTSLNFLRAAQTCSKTFTFIATGGDTHFQTSMGNIIAYVVTTLFLGHITNKLYF
jgi:hypothetical protein